MDGPVWKKIGLTAKGLQQKFSYFFTVFKIFSSMVHQTRPVYFGKFFRSRHHITIQTPYKNDHLQQQQKEKKEKIIERVHIFVNPLIKVVKISDCCFRGLLRNVWMHWGHCK